MSDLRVAAGPDVPIAVRDGTALLVPGGKRFTIGVRPTHLQACDSDIATSPDGRWVANGTKRNLRAVDLNTRKLYDLGIGCASIWGASGLAYASVGGEDSYGNDANTLAVLSDANGPDFPGLGNGVYIGNHLLAGLSYTEGGSAHLPPALYRYGVSGNRLTHQLDKNLAPGETPLFNSIGFVTRINSLEVAVVRGAAQGSELLTCQISDLTCTGDAQLH